MELFAFILVLRKYGIKTFFISIAEVLGGPVHVADWQMP